MQLGWGGAGQGWGVIAVIVSLSLSYSASLLLLTRLSLAPLGLELKEWGEVMGVEKATPVKSDVHANFLWGSWQSPYVGPSMCNSQDLNENWPFTPLTLHP